MAYYVISSLIFYINPSITYTFFKIPDIGISVSDSSYQLASSQSSNTTKEIALTISVGLTKEVSENLSLVFNTSYLKSTHDTEYKVSGLDQNNQVTNLKTNHEDEFSAITCSIGLIFRLSSKDTK